MRANYKAFAGLLLVGLATPNSQAQVGFSQQNFATGAGPGAVVVKDFNGDGVLDLATANSRDNSVSIFLGNGDGTFGAKTDFATGLGPRGVVAADFNGDTKLDLATANDTDNSLSVLLGNGDGTFQAKPDSPSGIGPVAVVAGDFNGDGRIDLAAANRADNTISVLLGNGDGSFIGKMDFLTGTEPLSIVVGDFNGDGKLDIATSNGSANAVSVLLGKGDGTFDVKMDSPTGSNPRSLTAIDFNLDGKLDLATSNQSNDTASLLLGNANGTFNPRTDLGTDNEPIAVTAPDFDNDGKPDLATANNGLVFTRCGFRGCPNFRPSLSLRLGNGDGTFGNQLFFVLGSRSPINLGPRAAAAATGDFNADGKVDLAITDPAFNLVRVLLQAPALSFSHGSLLFSNFQIVGTPSAPIDLTISSTGSFSAVFGTAAISGTDAGDFSIIADNCSGATVPVGSSCVVSVTFTPSTLSAKSASLTIPNNAAGNPHVVSLKGGGAPNAPVAHLSATSVNLGDQLVGGPGLSFSATLRNIGGVTMNVSSITIAGPNASDFRLDSGGSACPMTAFALAPGDQCELAGTFTPGAVGARSATIAITSDAAGSPHMVALSGNAVSISITPPSSIPPIQAGQSATFMLQVQAGSAATTVTLSCTHMIPAGACNVPSSLAIPGTVTVTVTTTARGSLPPLSSQRRFPPVGRPEIYVWVIAWLTLALAGFLVRWRPPVRLRLSAAAVATVVLCLVLWSGCGEGSSAPQRGTPPGTYSITVQASSGGATSSTSVDIVVR